MRAAASGGAQGKQLGEVGFDLAAPLAERQHPQQPHDQSRQRRVHTRPSASIAFQIRSRVSRNSLTALCPCIVTV